MLVDYSDSDTSDTEKSPPPPPKPTSLSALLPKPKARRNRDVASSAECGPKKIVVNLPKIEDEELELPPTKKARIGGGRGSGLSALLPAPKRKRDAPLEEKNAQTETEHKNEKADDNVGVEDEKPEKPKQMSSTIFVPQSVARKPIQPMSAFKKGKGGGTTVAGGPQAKAKPKVSLFGSGTMAVASTAQNKSMVTATASEYKPMMLGAAQPARRPVEEEGDIDDSNFGTGNISTEQVAYTEGAAYQQPVNDVNALAQDIGLDEASMRQLYGRRGKEPITFSNFSVDDEYRQNELERALGLAEEVNPVRTIQPGKHQLRTLLTAAQSQRSALEDSFAQGKKNRKEAGSKYGWA